MDKIKVLIVDDHGMIRFGLEELVNRQPDLEVVAVACSGEEALQKVAALEPQLVIMDLQLPGMNGLEATRQMKKAHPGIEVLVLTVKDEQEYFFAAMDSGVSGYLLKETEPADILTGIRAVAQGRAFFSPQMAKLLVQRYNDEASQRLSDREDQVLAMAACGKTNREIAASLSLSTKTVEKHRARAMSKLGLRSRTDLIRYALIHGVIEPSPFP